MSPATMKGSTRQGAAKPTTPSRPTAREAIPITAQSTPLVASGRPERQRRAANARLNGARHARGCIRYPHVRAEAPGGRSEPAAITHLASRESGRGSQRTRPHSWLVPKVAGYRKAVVGRCRHGEIRGPNRVVR